jgi:hypothetical protein
VPLENWSPEHRFSPWLGCWFPPSPIRGWGALEVLTAASVGAMYAGRRSAVNAPPPPHPPPAPPPPPATHRHRTRGHGRVVVVVVRVVVVVGGWGWVKGGEDEGALPWRFTS